MDSACAADGEGRLALLAVPRIPGVQNDVGILLSARSVRWSCGASHLFVGIILFAGRCFCGSSSNWSEQRALSLFGFESSCRSHLLIEGYHVRSSWIIFIVFVESINL